MSLELCINAVKASTEYELQATELKRQYILSNVLLFNYITTLIHGYNGSFGSGYPFYALEKDLNGDLPIIIEQVRYNNELIDNINNLGITSWNCADCLIKCGDSMPDLKQICKPCPNVDNELKPRKVINRLPDIDLWFVCEDDEIYYAKDKLGFLLNFYGLHTSDVSPLRTMQEVIEITNSLKAGTMPEHHLPLDAHIIGKNALYNLIEQVPDTIKKSFANGQIPYLPIHPLSLRKTWQYDDTAYNFVHDFLSSITEYGFNPDLQILLEQTRKEIATTYSFDELYNILITTGPESVLRRHRTRELKDRFEERTKSWRR